jgi:hypothetical protein
MQVGFDPERLAAACNCARLHLQPLAKSTVLVQPSFAAADSGGIGASRPAARLCVGVAARVQQALRQWEELAAREWSDAEFAVAFREEVERLCGTGRLDQAVSACRSAMATYQEVDASVVFDMLARVLLLQGRDIDAQTTSLIGGVVQLADIYTKISALQALHASP